MDKIKLKPCPFCGKAAEIMDYIGRIQPDNKHRFSVWCDSCELAFGYCEDYGGKFETQEKAAEAWNRRADGGWIPVAERLPKYGERVLCCVLAGKGIFFGILWPDEIEGDEWAVYDGGIRIPEEVTHWRPLPAPPVKKEEL